MGPGDLLPSGNGPLVGAFGGRRTRHDNDSAVDAVPAKGRPPLGGQVEVLVPRVSSSAGLEPSATPSLNSFWA